VGTYQLAELAYDTAAQIAAERFGGEEALFNRFLNNREEPLWYVSGGRHYLRPRAALAALLWKQREYKQAKDLYQTLLKLNPPDNQGIRYELICLLLEAGDHRALASALKKTRWDTSQGGQREDVAGTIWHYTNALYRYRMFRAASSETLEHAGSEATRALQEAFGQNRYVPLLLLAPAGLPKNEDLAGYSKGDATEATLYVNMSRRAWRSTPGALEWLEKMALGAHLLPTRGKDIPRISINVVAQQPDEEGGEGEQAASTRKLHVKSVQHFGAANATREPLRISEEDAERTLDAFWKRISFPENSDANACWLWQGDSFATLYHRTEPRLAGTTRVDPLHLAWVIGTGHALSDSYSQLMPTCQSLTCINPAHRQAVLPLDRINRVMEDDSYLLGADDLRELAWRFRTDVGGEQTFRGSGSVLWDGQWFVSRDVYEQWRRTRGRRLEEAFRKKYITPWKYWHVLAGEGAGEGQSDLRDTAEEQWTALGVVRESIPQLVKLYQQLLTEHGGAAIDDPTARYHLDRLCMRIIVRGGCWYWDKPESNSFRLVKNGPTTEPRYLLWRLFRDATAHPRYSTIASHDGDSACLCPAHSDILLDTSEASLLLAFASAPPSAHQSLTLEQIEPLRSALHEAVEQCEIPYRINAASGIDLWRSDVLSWRETYRQRVDTLVSEALKDAAAQQEEKGDDNAESAD